MSEEAAFMDGGNKHKMCEVDLRNGNVVTVEPYAIYTSPKKRRSYLWYQFSRAGAQGENGWRNVEASEVKACKVVERDYVTRKDYNPFDKVTMVMCHYSIPAADGKKRPVDLAPAWDKSIHNKPAG